MRNKKKLILGTISSVVIFAIIIILTPSNFILSVITPDINLKDENFDGIDLKQNINKLNVDKNKEDINNPHIHYLSNGIGVITNENSTIKYIAINNYTDRSVKTSRGISVGSSLDNVKRYYGEDYYNRREQGAEIIVYIDNNRFLEFWHWNNEVQGIRFGFN
ncbi:hypothetical protein JNUCC23_23020 (plasmid) [Peribacillus sp. JNUCC 23]